MLVAMTVTPSDTKVCSVSSYDSDTIVVVVTEWPPLSCQPHTSQITAYIVVVIQWLKMSGVHKCY